MSAAASANEKAGKEINCADTTNEDVTENKVAVKVKIETPEDKDEGDDKEKVKVKTEPKDPKDGVPVKLKRKGRRGRSSGTLTMKGDKITSFTTERGVTYAPNGMLFGFYIYSQTSIARTPMPHLP